MSSNLSKVLNKLQWMKKEKIWPNGKRYLWTDSYGIILLVSLYKETKEIKYLQEAEWVIDDVKKKLGRKKGVRIGEDPDRDGQYFHYLSKWVYALNEIGKFIPQYHDEAVKTIKDIHPHFYVPHRGIIWKMKEDLSGIYEGYGFGGLDHYDAFVTYRQIDENSLGKEISQVYELVKRDYNNFSCSQDLGLGETLWMAHHYPKENWAEHLTTFCLNQLNDMWVSNSKDKGYFMRDAVWERNFILAFGNFGVSIGLQSVHMWHGRIEKLHNFFDSFQSNDKYDREAITHVMHCNSLFPGVLIKKD
eukprot:gene7809-12282_t